MKHILSTITVLFILVASSVSRSERVGYGDLRIGSDKSVVDEHCEQRASGEDENGIKYTINRCYDLDIEFKFHYLKDHKTVRAIGMYFLKVKRSKFISFDEYINNEGTVYYQINEKLSKQFDRDGIWYQDEEEEYIISFNGSTIWIIVNNFNSEGFWLRSIDYFNNIDGWEKIQRFNSNPLFKKYFSKKDFLDRFS